MPPNYFQLPNPDAQNFYRNAQFEAQMKALGQGNYALQNYMLYAPNPTIQDVQQQVNGQAQRRRKSAWERHNGNLAMGSRPPVGPFSTFPESPQRIAQNARRERTARGYQNYQARRELPPAPPVEPHLQRFGRDPHPRQMPPPQPLPQPRGTYTPIVHYAPSSESTPFPMGPGEQYAMFPQGAYPDLSGTRPYDPELAHRLSQPSLMRGAAPGGRGSALYRRETGYRPEPLSSPRSPARMDLAPRGPELAPAIPTVRIFEPPDIREEPLTVLRYTASEIGQVREAQTFRIARAGLGPDGDNPPYGIHAQYENGELVLRFTDPNPATYSVSFQRRPGQVDRAPITVRVEPRPAPRRAPSPIPGPMARIPSPADYGLEPPESRRDSTRRGPRVAASSGRAEGMAKTNADAQRNAKELKQSREELQKLSSQVKSLQERLGKTRNQRAEIQKRIQQWTEEIKKLQGTRAGILKQLQGLQADLKAAGSGTDAAERIEKTIDALTVQVQETLKDVGRLEKLIRELTNQVETLDTTAKGLEEEIKKIRSA